MRRKTSKIPVVILLAVATATLIAVRAVSSGEVSHTNDATTSQTYTVESSTATTVRETTKAVTEATTSEAKPIIYNPKIPLPDYLQTAMQQACSEYGVPYALALAVAECESSFDLEADSGICWGLMQINPVNYAQLRELGIEPTEYKGNIVAGVFILSGLLNKYGDTHKALMAYNCGEYGASRLWNQGCFTSGYSRKVTETQTKWQQILNDKNDKLEAIIND